MSARVSRPAAVAALVLSVGLACLPACKKKPTESGSPAATNPAPPPGPTNTGDGRDPQAPRSPVFGASTDAPYRAKAKVYFDQIGIALHGYHDAYARLPGGYADKTGKPGLSWRVAVLPYLEQENLFRQFKLDEPWDSEHNKKLIPLMPAVFAPPNQSTNGYTFVRGFTGPGAWLRPQQARPGVREIPSASFSEITDGMVNTILVAEAWTPVIWTKPDELEYAPGKVPALGGVFSGGTHAVFADGKARFLRKGTDEKTIAALITINGGEVVNLDN